MNPVYVLLAKPTDLKRRRKQARAQDEAGSEIIAGNTPIVHETLGSKNQSPSARREINLPVICALTL
jgi:hypothetical protein